MSKFLQEFKSFAMKGNVVDLAVGVIIGSAFNAIVSSLVKDIITPLLSLLLGRINISDLKFTIPGILGSADIVLSYGAFLQAIINFLVIAFSVFLMIKAMNKVRGKFHVQEEEKKEESQAEPNHTEVLLTEIRDLLKEQAQKSEKES